MAAKEPSHTPAKAGRPKINTAARAIPADGKIGEIFPGGIVTRKLTFAIAAYTIATTRMATGDESKIRGVEKKLVEGRKRKIKN